MSDHPPDPTPAPVPTGATRAGEMPPGWGWVERAVWTPRMVTALIEGVKGGRWFTLTDKVMALRTRRAAWAGVRANHGAAGVDPVTIAPCEAHLDAHLTQLSEQRRTNTIVSLYPYHLTCLRVGGPCLCSPMEAGVFRPRGSKAE